MILISHRGNIDGPNPDKENNLDYIDKAISEGYDVEIDIWHENRIIFLGHDEPQYKVSVDWLRERKDNLWFHCKDLDSLSIFSTLKFSTYSNWKFFWHQNDYFTLTSNNLIWTYPGHELTETSIAVLPEQANYYDWQLEGCYGICSDFISQYKK
jgi:hypothetical protein